MAELLGGWAPKGFIYGFGSQGTSATRSVLRRRKLWALALLTIGMGLSRGPLGSVVTEALGPFLVLPALALMGGLFILSNFVRDPGAKPRDEPSSQPIGNRLPAESPALPTPEAVPAYPSLISKPAARDLQERRAVTTLRYTGKAAEASIQGARDLHSNLARWFFIGLMGVWVLCLLVGFLGYLSIPVIIGGMSVLVERRKRKRANNAAMGAAFTNRENTGWAQFGSQAAVEAPSTSLLGTAAATLDPTFDPDAIMAHYLDQRAVLLASQQALREDALLNHAQPSRPVFGRKIA